VTVETRQGLLGGIVALRHKAVVAPRREGPLYESLEAERRARRSAEVTLIPYYTFANREATPMEVWIPYID
jgi:DUF1680 family protein